MTTIVGIGICFDAPLTRGALKRHKERFRKGQLTAMVHGLGALAPLPSPRPPTAHDLPSAYVLRESLVAMAETQSSQRAARIMDDSERLQERLRRYEKVMQRVGRTTEKIAFGTGLSVLAALIAGAIITAMNDMTATSAALSLSVLLC